MKWVTRERPKIDRIACPWLIERFIEKQPEFLYVPADKVLATAKETGAIPYDIPGVKFSHVGEKCSFNAFIAEYKLDPTRQGSISRRSQPACSPSRSASATSTPTTTRC